MREFLSLPSLISFFSGSKNTRNNKLLIFYKLSFFLNIPTITMIRLFTVVVTFLATSPSTVRSYSLFSQSTGTDEQKNVNVEAEASRKTKQAGAGTIPPISHHRQQQQQQQQQIISSGLFHNCAITQRNGMADDSCGGGAKKCGRVKCWGHNDHEQSSPPPGVGLLTDISAGGFFTCGLKVGGEAVCWGEIDHPPRSLEKVKESMSRDELANFHHAQRLNKATMTSKSGRYGKSTVNGGDYYDKISSGMKHACAVTREGEVHCWGRNDYGESTPPSDKKFTQVSSYLERHSTQVLVVLSLSFSILRLTIPSA